MPPGRRKGWANLSEAQRKRYLGAGVTKSAYESGAPLDAARGHRRGGKSDDRKPRPPRGVRPPKVALKKLNEGLANTRERRAVERWYENEAPAWLRSPDLGADTAGLIYEANLQPQNFGDMEIYFQRDGSVRVYIESRRGGPTREIEFGDRDNAHEFVNWYESFDYEDPSDIESFGSGPSEE